VQAEYHRHCTKSWRVRPVADARWSLDTTDGHGKHLERWYRRALTKGARVAKTSHGTHRYGTKASEKVERAMHELKEGTLRSGGSGKKVTSRKQAIAIGLSEARDAGAKVPRKPRS